MAELILFQMFLLPGTEIHPGFVKFN